MGIVKWESYMMNLFKQMVRDVTRCDVSHTSWSCTHQLLLICFPLFLCRSLCANKQTLGSPNTLWNPNSLKFRFISKIDLHSTLQLKALTHCGTVPALQTWYHNEHSVTFLHLHLFQPHNTSHRTGRWTSKEVSITEVVAGYRCGFSGWQTQSCYLEGENLG